MKNLYYIKFIPAYLDILAEMCHNGPNGKCEKRRVKVDKLTYEQLEIIISRFRTSCYQLRQFGDYPSYEEKRDKNILDILINMKWNVGREEGIL